nr:hypothetical protein [Solirubrobacterales bacterium]
GLSSRVSGRSGAAATRVNLAAALRGRPKRLVLLAALALLVPLPALATDSAQPEPGPVAIQVSASLDSCGLLGTDVVCKIDASWSQVDGATRYTASVSAPDGSVTDAGDVPASGTSVWVPYVGDGTYTVQITAYGDPPGPVERGVLARGEAIDPGSNAVEGGSGSKLQESPTGSKAGGVEQVPVEPVEPVEPTEPAPEETTTTPEETVPVVPEPPPVVEPPAEPIEPECVPPSPEQIAEHDAQVAEQERLVAEAEAAGEPAPVLEPIAPLPVCP